MVEYTGCKNKERKQEIPHSLIRKYITECVSNLMEGFSVMKETSRGIDFILSPGKYLDELSGIYKDYPELKKSNRLKR